MKWRKLNITEIAIDEFYSVHEIALMLWVNTTTITRKIHKWELKASNLWTEKKGFFRIKWIDLLEYLK